MLASILLLLASVHAQEAKQVLPTLGRDLKDKVVTIRNFYVDRELNYSSSGEVSNGTPGKWTIDGTIKIESIKTSGDQLIIDGQRLGVSYDTKKRDIALLRRKDKIRIRVSLSPEMTVEDLKAALSRIFIGNDEELLSAIPEYWRPWVGKHETQYPKPIARSFGSKTFRPGGDVLSPVVLHKPEPAYTPEAKVAGLEGAVLLGCVIDIYGQPTELRVLRPLGMELEEEAVKAVQQWRFRPATKKGTPVAVYVNIEVGFSLH